jgi:hypothetical protein
MLIMTATTFAFAGVYALIATMIGDKSSAIAAALRNESAGQAGDVTASRCLSRA